MLRLIRGGRSARLRPPRSPSAGSLTRPAFPARSATLVLALVAALGATAQASAAVLVSNLGQGNADVIHSGSAHTAQGFRTGAAGRSYTLTSIAFNYWNSNGTTPGVTVHEGSPTGTLVATLTGPNHIVKGVNTHTAPGGTSLKKETTYYAVISKTPGGPYYNEADSTDEDSGASAGWSIDDFRKSSTDGTSYSTVTGANPFHIRINGMVKDTNTAPTGLPKISNRTRPGEPPRVGDWLVAEYSDIKDVDGLSLIRFKAQWIRVDRGTRTDISGEVYGTYLLTDADENKKIKVKVTFTDNGGTKETLTSVATATVQAQAPATIPGQVQELTAIARGRKRIDVSWYAPSNTGGTGIHITGYKVEVSNDGSSWITLAASHSVRTHMHTGLSPGSTRYYRVSAINQAGTGAPTTSAAATTTANTAPTASAGTVTTPEDEDYIFTAANFNYMDADGDTLASVKIVTLATPGVLKLDTTPVTSNQEITKADIDDKKLKFSPVANANGNSYATFTFKVNDGTDDSASADTMTVNVTAVNDPATGQPGISGTAQVGQTLTASVSNIMDVDGLDGVSYSYQWFRFDSVAKSSETFKGNYPTYTIKDTDKNKKIEVKVFFTDDDGNNEALTSAATAVVAAADATAPTVTITDVPTTTNAAFTATFTFSETVTGFTLADITASGATASSFSADSGTTYTALITPTATNYSVSVATNVAQDAFSNGNTASAVQSGTYDTAAPMVAITDVPTTTNAAFTATFTFSETVTGFTLADITASGAAASSFSADSGTTYTATITPTADYSVSVAASVAQDAAGNDNAVSATASGTYDTAAPTVTITDVPTTANAAFTATFTFSETVTGFTLADITASGAAASRFSAVSGTTYTATITPTADYSVSVAASVAQDAAGNDNAVSATASGTYDTAAPTVTITDVPTTANAAFTATFTFSETVTGFTLADITASGAAASRFSAVSGTTYTATITPTADYSVSVAASVAQDAAGNDNAVSATASGTYDTAAPTVTITDVPTTANAAFTATFTFSETVTGFMLADITASGAAASRFSAVSGTTYTATITPTADYSVSVAASVAQDAAGNDNAVSATASGTYDTAAPTVTITDVPTTTNAAFTATFTFSETVTGFTLADITASGATASSFSADSGTTYTALITPTADYSVSVAASVAQDAAGNDNAPSSASGTYDTAAPMVTITDVPTTTNAAFTATFIFSETVTGFELADITASGAAASDFATVSSGTTYTALITPTADYSVSVAASVAQDAAGNDNAVSATASGTYDTAAPTVTITDVPTTANAAFTATFTFSETVTGFMLADITASGAAASRFSAVSGTTYTATITPTADYSVSVAASVAQDAAGNDNAVSATASGTYDTAAPTVTITDVPTTANAAFTATFTFSETVTGFMLADITASGAAASSFSAVSGTTYTATITPTADYSVSVAASVAQDAAGNDNAVSATASGTYDTAAPTVTITDVPTTANAAFTATFTFSETVTGFMLADITASGAAASRFSAVSGTTYTATITPTADYSVSVAASVAQDAAGNDNAVSATASGTYDTAAPTVTITDVPTTTNAAFTATFTFSETVTGFTLADITASGATASSFSADSGTTYTALITPTADYSVSVAASVAQDAAGNDNAPSSASGTYDTAAPMVTITDVPTTTNAAFTATFTFSETVTGFTLADITASGAAASSFSADSGTTYTALITPSADYSVSVAASVAQDAAGNDNAVSATASGTYDTAAPTVTITDVPTTANAAFTATFTFSETVTGFTLADITASGATASSFSADSGTTYTALITPTADYSVSVAASVAQDAAGNDNAVSATASGTYDTAAPTVTITDVPTTANAAFTATFTFSETVTGFMLADITASGAAASRFSAVSGTTYTATITPTADYSVSVAASVAQDAAGNDNAVSATASGTYDADAPTVTITDVPTTANAAFTATFTFSETVTGFTLADITASGAAASSFSADSGTTYTATITPTADYSVSVAASVAQDAAGNDNAVSATASGTYDTAAPTVTITDVPTTANAAFTATFTFSETVTGFMLADITASGAAASRFSAVSGTTYTATITPTADYSVSVAASVAQDAAGNDNAVSATASGTYDTAAPTVTITDVPTTANAAFTATFTFSETVTGFMLADITASGAAASRFSADSGTTYTALITPTADYSVSVAASVAQDAAGNDNAVSATASGTYDADAPTVTITDVPTTANAAFTATFTFSETVTGFMLADITASGAAASRFSAVSGTTYTATITPTADYSVSVAASVAQDAAGNDNAVSATASGTYDADAPTVTITDVPTTANAAFTATFTFSETVTGFMLADITASGAAASRFSAVSGTTYTATITPTADYSVSVAASVAQDAAGNDNAVSATASGTYDTAAPTVTITDVPTTANAAFTATFTFSETVTGFELADITASGAAASSFATTVSGTTYTALITPSGTNYSVSVAEGAAQDAAGNDNAASSASGTYDAAAPNNPPTGLPRIDNRTSPGQPPRVGDWLVAEYSDIKDVDGLSLIRFKAQWIRVDRGTRTDISGEVYGTYLLTDADENKKIKVKVTFTDNGGTKETLTSVATATVQAQAPATIPGQVQELTAIARGRKRIDVSWYAPSNTGGTGIHITGYKVEVSNDGSSWITLAASHSVRTHMHTGLSPGSTRYYRVSAINQAGTGAPTTSAAATTTANTAPTASAGTVTTPEDEDYIFTAANFNYMDADGDTLASVKIVTLATPGVLKLDTTPVTSNQEITKADIDDKKLKFSPVANANGNSYATFTFKVNDGTDDSASADTMTVNVTAVNDPATGQPGISGTAQVGQTLTASVSNIMDVDGLDGVSYSYQWFRFDSVAKSSETFKGNYPTYTIKDTDKNKKIEVKVFFTDDDGNNEALTSAATAVVAAADATAPTVTITDVPTTTNAAFTATFTFSETVTGFTLADITASGAAASSFATTVSGTTYTALITPSGTNYSVSVAEGAAQDAFSNGNTVSATASGTYDADAPTVTITDVPTTANAAFTATFTFSETVTGFTLADITASGAAASSFATTVSGTTYTALITPSGTNYSVSVAEGAAQDAFSNGNTASAVQSGTYDADAPTVTITDVPTTANAAFTATFTFSETVTGFTLADITASGAAASRFATTVSGTTYTALITPSGTNYSVSVAEGAAQDAFSNGNAVSATQSGTYDAAAPNNPPTGLPRIDNRTSPGQPPRVGDWLVAEYSDIKDVDGLSLIRFKAQWIRVDRGTRTDISGEVYGTYLLTDADENKKIKVKVTFTDNGGTKETLTSVATATVQAQAPATIPGQVQELTAIARGRKRIDVSWYAPSNTGGTGIHITGYKVEVSNDGSSWITLAASHSVRTHMHTGLSPGSTRYYRVSAINQAGTGPPTTSARATTTANTAPTVATQIPDQAATAGTEFSYTVPAGTFTDADGDPLTYTATRGDASALPVWLSFATSSRVFSGTPQSADTRTVTVKVTASDDNGSSVSDTFDIMVSATTTANTAPTVATQIPDQAATAGTEFSYTVPAGTFTDADGDPLTYTATRGDASALPVWLSFATSSRVFSGTPQSADTRTVTVKVTASDDNGSSVSDTFDIMVSAAPTPNTAPTAATAIPAWLARFGGAVTDPVLDAVTDRLAAPRSPGMTVSLAGRALPTRGQGNAVREDRLAGNAGSLRASLAERGAMDTLRNWISHTGAEGDDVPAGAPGAGALALQSWSPTGRDWTSGTSFALTGESRADGALLSVWGRGAMTNFDARDGDLALDGEAQTLLVGAERSWRGWTTGGILGRSRVEGGYRSAAETGKIQATLTGVYPWAGRAVNDQVSAWAAVGYGAGDLTLQPEGGGRVRTDLSLALGAAGLRGEVLRPLEAGGLSLAVKGDVRFTRAASKAAEDAVAGRLMAAEADVWRVRAGVEGARSFMANDDAWATVTPSFEVGVRLDGGDAETGFGADVGGGVALVDPGRGVTLEMKARGLAAHEAEGFREWGASAALAWEPRPQSGRGLSLSLTQSWGASSSGGMDALLSRDTLVGLAASDTAPAGRRLEAELGYGMTAFGGDFTATPNAGLTLTEGGRDWRIGWRLTPAWPDGSGFEVNLDATRSETGDQTPEHAVTLRGTLRF